MKKSLYPLLLLGAVLSTFHTVHAQCDRTADSLELVHFYHHFNGPGWTVQWDFNSPMDTWPGITMDTLGCLYGITLNKKNLVGEVYDFNFPRITFLYLNQNKISGQLPDFSQLDSLAVLHLSRNELFGSIPNFSRLPNLYNLDISYNDFQGILPNFSSTLLLRRLDIQNNRLMSPLPDINQLVNLNFFSIANNTFQEPFPNINLPQLTELNLKGNNFYGMVPDINGLPSLFFLDISANDFTGELPDFQHMPMLTSFWAMDNGLSGEIPDFTGVPNLYSLKLSSNNLSGLVPDFQHVAQLSELWLSFCELSGNIPDFSSLPNLQNLFIEGNNLEGSLPVFQNSSNLKWINIRSNQIDSIISFQFYQNIEVLELSNNLIRYLPDVSYLTRIKRIYLNRNALIGVMPSFSNLEFLEELVFSENSITEVRLISNLPKLKTIWGQKNLIKGNLPLFSNCTDLENIDLSDNFFSGAIPDYGHLSKLSGFSARNNRLQGKMPDYSTNLFLNTLYLENNQIDSCSQLNPNITYLNISQNDLTFDDLFGIPAPQHFIAPMNPVKANPSFTLQGDSLLIDLKFDAGITTSTYRWFKNESIVPFAVTPVNKVWLTEFIETDTISVVVTNPEVPGLTLYVNPFNLRDIKPVVRGIVFKDDNGNCQFDAAETKLNRRQVELAGNNGTYYTQTFEDGTFQAITDTGMYSISVLLPNNGWRICPGNYSISAGYGDTIDLYIPLEAYEDCAEMLVNAGIENPNLRRCFDNRYAINYCNTGTTEAQNVEVFVQVDSWIRVDSFSVPSVSLGNGKYRVSPGAMGIGDCGSFLMYVQPDCDAPLGLVQCVYARVEPADICSTLASQWSGATISANGYCDGDQAHLLLRNTGHQAPADSLEYRIYQNGVLVEAARYRLAAGDSLVFHRPGGNDAWRLETDQAPGHPCSVLPSVFVEGCGPGLPGQAVTSYALQFPDDSNCPFEDKVCFPITGSYDPNDKTAFPVGYGPDHLIEPGTDIEYLVRFQNVGNDTAFHVFVRDTLSAFLDPATVEVTGFSHPYQLNVDSTGALEFAFYHIHLTDTITDEPGSHGYIRFRVSQKSGNIIGAIIRNQAAIYFDFNAPIITNLVFHTLGVDFVPDALAPVWETPPADLVFNCHRNMDVDALIQQWLNNAGGALVSDHSMPITLSNDYTALSGGCNGFSGTATVTFTATDRWGNSSASIATLSAMDTIPPVWEILPQSVEIACSEDLPTRLADWLLDNGGGEVSDACGTVAVTYAYELSGACTDSTLVTFIAADECGNTAQIQAYFIVSNSLPPAITAPASDLILPCDAPDLPVRIQQWLLEHGGAQAEGACSSVSWRHVLGQPTPGCGNTGETSVTFIAEDACGNAASLSARIRLVDTVAPVWTAAPENLILYCGAATEATIQVWLQQAGGGAATDACSAIAMSYNYNGLSNGCNPQTGTATVVFTAEDACGNRSTRSAMIEVRDTTPPVWTQLPTPIVLQCGEDLWGAFLPWLANSGGGMVEDDCGTSSITYFYTEQVDCLDPDTLHVVFSGRDACGNVSEVTIPVVVLRPTDTYNPAFEISSIRVFPNPARESVQIQWQGAENESFRLQLWNASGHVMTTVEGRGHALELSVAAYSSGVYFFAIETAGGKKGYGRVVRM